MNPFKLSYYAEFLQKAKQMGYAIMTLDQYWRSGCPTEGALVLRHDLDIKPWTLNKMLDVERDVGCRSTIYVRVAGAPYNFLDYPTFRVLLSAQSDGFEIGLHSNYYEFAKLNSIGDPLLIIQSELKFIKNFFNIMSIAPHRDIEYVHNSLPHLVENWDRVQAMGLKFQAYNDIIMTNATYVNEGFNPHIGWRNSTPEDVIKTHHSLYVLTHPHWWYVTHPFEQWDLTHET